jgi:anti-sigma B factor antagonist
VGCYATVRQVEAVTVVDISGRLTLAESDGLRAILFGELRNGRKQLLLNLRDVTYFDSAGLGELLGCYTAIARTGGALKLLCAPKKLRDTLQVTRLDTLFEFFSDEADAVRNFGITTPKRSSKLRDHFRNK